MSTNQVVARAQTTRISHPQGTTPRSNTMPCSRQPNHPEVGANGGGQSSVVRTVQQVIPEVFYEKDTGKYWRKIRHEFVPCDERNLKRHFRMSGFDVTRFAANGLTDFDVALCHAQNASAVDKVIALAGHKPGVFVHESGARFLVPRGPALVVPRKGDIRNWLDFLIELLGPYQMPCVLGWLKTAIEDLRTLDPAAWHQSQLLALAGAVNCGKSFFQFLIRLLLGGRQAEPYLWMVGRSNFNDDLAESEHLMMEDKEAHRSMGDRARFGARIKQITTGGETPIHAKGKKQFFAPCFRRLTLSLNCNPEAITILPPLTADIRDKLQLMKCSPATMLSDYAENVARFRKELPAFTHYLLHEFQIPPGMQDARFGVKAYVNPEIEEILLDFEPHLRLLEVIDLTFFKDGTEGIKETPSEIQGRLLSGPMGDVARQLLNYSTALGQLLARLAQEFPSRFQRTKSKGERRWNILPPEE